MFIEDTFRAEWAWQILFVPERIPGMVQSMLADYQEVSHRSAYASHKMERSYPSSHPFFLVMTRI